MSVRELQRPSDFQRMCKQAERDQEGRKLVLLMDRLQRKLQEQGNTTATSVETPKPPVSSIAVQRFPARTSFFER